MKSLDERYRAYLDERRRDADKALADKGLEPVGLNHLRYDLIKLPALIDRNDFADMLDQVKEETTKPHIAQSLAFSKTQTARAKKPRGKLVENKTIGGIIEKVVRNHPGETAKELWQPFINQLEAYGLQPHESTSGPILVQYEVQTSQRQMTFRTFQNRVSNAKAN